MINAKKFSSILEDLMTIRELKETQGGERHMCEELQMLWDEAIQVGEIKTKKETAVVLADRDIEIDEIADILKVSVDTVQEWLS